MTNLLNFFKIENISTINNITYYHNNENKLIELPIGAHLKYDGAFGITKNLLGNIHPKLENYVPSHHAVFIGNSNIVHFNGGHNTNNLMEASVVCESLENFVKSAEKRNSPVFCHIHSNASNSDVIKKRCQEMIGKKNYNILSNNCEHLANYCITGNRKCYQIEKFVEDTLHGSLQFLIDKIKN